MSPLHPDHDFKAIKKEELPLSGRALGELLQAVFRKNAPFRFKAGGFSMSPFIKDGDILTVSPLGQAPPKVGEIVIFIHPITRKPVVHRLVGKSGNAYLAKRDNSRGRDHPLPLKSIVGRLDGLERNGKKVTLGFGPERRLIALLSRNGMFVGLLSPLWRAFRLRKKGLPYE